MNKVKHTQNQINSNSSLHKSNQPSKSFATKKEEKRYWIILISLILLGGLAAFGLLTYNNPVPVDSPSFIPVVKRRIIAIIAMILAAVCHGLATVAFQSITNNKVITPSLLGFEALYSTIQTSTMFIFGTSVFIGFSGSGPFFVQVGLMVLFSLILYGWLLSGKYGNLQLMLLIGIILGTGLRSLSTFMRKLLEPSEFDILQARLFGSVNNADPEYFPVAIPIIIIVALLVIVNSRNLNVLSLGKDIASSLGVSHRANVVYMLILIAILMAISTALIGPLTFYGFLIATLSYQFASTYDHRYIFPMALTIGFVILTGAYFIMYHVFDAQGVVSVIIEIVGGLTFLIIILRRKSL